MKGRWLCGMQRTVATMPLIGRNIKDWDIPPPQIKIKVLINMLCLFGIHCTGNCRR